MGREMSEKSLANLRPPIRKGEVMNPNGYNGRTIDLTAVVRQVLAEVPDKKDARNRLVRIVQKMSDKAERGDVKAATLILERGFGKAVQPILVRDELVLVDFTDAE